MNNSRGGAPTNFGLSIVRVRRVAVLFIYRFPSVKQRSQLSRVCGLKESSQACQLPVLWYKHNPTTSISISSKNELNYCGLPQESKLPWS